MALPPDQGCAPAPGMHLYIYYHAADCNTAAIIKAVSHVQEQLRRSHHVRCGLMQRPKMPENQVTWMEIYLDTSIGFDTALGAAIAQTNLLEMIVGQRHSEYFNTCLPCI